MTSKTKSLQHYINEIANKYTMYFNVYRNEMLGEIPLVFAAHYHRKDEKYLISKTIKIWGVENQQSVFAVAPSEPVHEAMIDAMQKNILAKVKEYVPHNEEHMSTVFIGVFLTDHPVSKNVIKKVRKLRNIKFLKFGLHGWIEMYIAVIDVANKQIYIHRKGKEFMKIFENTLNEEGSL
jgi:hypothetical protein